MNTQFYYVTVKEALQRGRMNLKIVPLVLLIIPLAIYFFLLLSTAFFPAKTYIPVTLDQGSFSLLPIGGLVASFCWRSLHSAAWKIWALENVRDVHRCFQLAISEGMIYERGSWPNRLEIKNSEQRMQLEQLETRLDAPREMENAGFAGIGGEQSFPYSWKMLLFPFTLALPAVVFIYWRNGKFEIFPFGIFLTILVTIQLFRWVPRIGQPAPIRFDENTLTIRNKPPMAWSDITNLTVEIHRRGKSTLKTLVVETKYDPFRVKLEISDIAGSSAEIEQTLYDYWVQAIKK